MKVSNRLILGAGFFVVCAFAYYEWWLHNAMPVRLAIADNDRLLAIAGPTWGELTVVDSDFKLVVDCSHSVAPGRWITSILGSKISPYIVVQYRDQSGNLTFDVVWLGQQTASIVDRPAGRFVALRDDKDSHRSIVWMETDTGEFVFCQLREVPENNRWENAPFEPLTRINCGYQTFTSEEKSVNWTDYGPLLPRDTGDSHEPMSVDSEPGLKSFTFLAGRDSFGAVQTAESGRDEVVLFSSSQADWGDIDKSYALPTTALDAREYCQDLAAGVNRVVAVSSYQFRLDSWIVTADGIKKVKSCFLSDVN